MYHRIIRDKRGADSSAKSGGRFTGSASCIMARWLILPFLVVCLVPLAQSQVVANPAVLWRNLLTDAARLNLPVKFLDEIPAGFVHFEFDDLRTFAAEYHPEDHRMILNRALSFNRAGGTLRALHQLTHKDLQTLYHELFHAFMDYLTVESRQSSGEGTPSDPLMRFAREQQHCRYEQVLITPIPQRKSHTEERFLREEESWELLNETWAVFIGWAIWTQLEVVQSKHKQPIDSVAVTRDWIERLRKADKQAELRGYYEPQDAEERAMSQKRFMAPAFRISPPEVKILMRRVLESSSDRIDHSIQMLENTRGETPVHLCVTAEAP